MKGKKPLLAGSSTTVDTGGGPSSRRPTPPRTVCSTSAVRVPVRHVQFAGAADGLLMLDVQFFHRYEIRTQGPDCGNLSFAWYRTWAKYVSIPSGGSGKQVQGSGTLLLFVVYFTSVCSALLFWQNLGWENCGWRTERTHCFINLAVCLLLLDHFERSMLRPWGRSLVFQGVLIACRSSGGTPVQPV